MVFAGEALDDINRIVDSIPTESFLLLFLKLVSIDSQKASIVLSLYSDIYIFGIFSFARFTFLDIAIAPFRSSKPIRNFDSLTISRFRVRGTCLSRKKNRGGGTTPQAYSSVCKMTCLSASRKTSNTNRSHDRK